MPSPSRWGLATRAINISAPDWVWRCMNDVWKKQDYRSISDAALEFIVRRLHEEGYPIPDEYGGPDAVTRKKGRK